MKSLRSTIVVLGVGLLATGPVAAQQPNSVPSTVVPQRQLSLDLAFAGVNVGYAVRNSSNTSFGVALGAGGNWMSYMAIGGKHFAESNGLSYEAKDGAENKELLELLRATAFVRRHFSSGRQLDLGLKASAFLHSDSADDDPGGGVFVGLNATAMWWRWRHIGLASELDAGVYSEGRPEFGANVAPVMVRISIP